MTGFSQKQSLKFQHITSNEGLSQSNVQCILQDSRGYMWFGTEDGLNRYDGYSIKVYRTDPSKPNTLSSDFIKDIVEDSAGNLWVATWGGGLNRFDRKLETFTAYKKNEKDTNSISSNFLLTLSLISVD
jgi:ligand-binding sensor domain-containing protein